jgi:putative ABC transport system permease protein
LLAPMPEHSRLNRGFSMRQMLWHNLGARPLRSTLTVIAISIQIVLVLLIVGMTSGQVADWGKRVEGVGADIIVQPPNSSIFFAFSSAVMQQSLGDQIAAIPGVDEVAPVLILVDSRGMTVVYGIDYPRFNALSSGFEFLSGGPFQGPDQAIVDDLASRTRRLKTGDKTSLLNHELTISGIVWHGKGARFYIPLRTAQDIAGAENRVSMFYVRSRGDTERTRSEIVKLLPTHRVRSTAEYVSLMNSSNLPELKPFIRSMVALGVAISFLVVLLTMHTMVLERTREIGILKALGSSRFAILRLIVGEALLLTVLGGSFGLACTYTVKAILNHTSPTLPILISWDWVARAVILAIVGSIAGALYPAFRASQADPVDALAYE